MLDHSYDITRDIDRLSLRLPANSISRNCENRKVVHLCAYMTKQYNLLDSAAAGLNEPPKWHKFPLLIFWPFFSRNCVTYPNSCIFSHLNSTTSSPWAPLHQHLRPFITNGALLPPWPSRPGRGVRGGLCWLCCSSVYRCRLDFSGASTRAILAACSSRCHQWLPEIIKLELARWQSTVLTTVIQFL